MRIEVERGEESEKMARDDVPAIEQIIANTIDETARGDPDALAARIVAALGEPDTVSSRRMGGRKPHAAPFV
jgi:hypothetical protein